MRFVRDVAAISRKIERRVRFVRLAVAIRQLANKMGLVAASPKLREDLGKQILMNVGSGS